MMVEVEGDEADLQTMNTRFIERQWPIAFNRTQIAQQNSRDA